VSYEFTDTGATLTMSNYTGAAITLQGIAAAYDEPGRLVDLSMMTQLLQAGESMELDLTFSADADVDSISSFVLCPITGSALKEVLNKSVSN